MEGIIYRHIKTHETAYLKEMLWEAIFLPAETKRTLSKALLEHPDIRKYYSGWGRKGDAAIVAVQHHSGMLTGCAWGRLFSASNKGYGYIGDEIPELSVAVEPAFRNRGIGTKLLQELMDDYTKKGFPKLSLSVHKNNPCLHLYYRKGFKVFAEKDDTLILQYQ